MSIAVCANLSLCLDVAVWLVNIAPGIAMAPNIALCLIVTIFALFETIFGVALALWPGALGCWVAGGSPSQGALYMFLNLHCQLVFSVWAG